MPWIFSTALFYTNLIIISTISTASDAKSAVVTRLRFVNASMSATAVPTTALIRCPEQYIMDGKVIADNTAYGI